MTREEAIKRLKEIDIRDALQEDYDALYMSIEALEQLTSYEQTINKLTKAISEQEPRKRHWKLVTFNSQHGEYRPRKYACSECGWTIDLCRGLQQDTGHRLFCEHCGARMVDEKDEYDMGKCTYKQEPFDIETYCKEHFCVMVDKDVWEKAEKALEQEPILDKIKAEIMQLYNEVEVVDYDRKDISRIKTAHWIIREEVSWIIDKYNSCPKRGADMREGE